MALDPEPAVADLLPERGGREVPVQALLRLGLVFEARVECWWIEDETEGHGALLEETPLVRFWHERAGLSVLFKGCRRPEALSKPIE
jgi:hypothetical protein